MLATAAALRDVLFLFILKSGGDAEVDEGYPFLLVEHYVLRLQVAMNISE